MLTSASVFKLKHCLKIGVFKLLQYILYRGKLVDSYVVYYFLVGVVPVPFAVSLGVCCILQHYISFKGFALN